MRACRAFNLAVIADRWGLFDNGRVIAIIALVPAAVRLALYIRDRTRSWDRAR
jgi:hypothetical protein